MKLWKRCLIPFLLYVLNDMKVYIVLLLLFSVSSSFAQVKPTEGMTYDAENKLYWKITNDEQNLYLKIYKDEYARKVDMQGGIKLFFNLEGEIC